MLPKNLSDLFWCMIAEDDSSRDMLSRLHVHTDNRDDVDFPAQLAKEAKPRCIHGIVLVVLICVAVIHIVEENH
jgi:hypothetical protein